MRKIIESLNMFLLDYLIVPIWAVFSILGNMKSGKIMVPITIVFIAVNYLNTRKTTKLFLLDINLAAASVAGIILNTFLYIRFVYADPKIITDMVTLIFLYTFFIIIASIFCLTLKVIMHRRNMRIISRMAEGAYDADDEDEYYDEDDEDEDEYEEDDEDGDSEEGTGFLTSIANLLKNRGDDEEDDEDDSSEDDEEEDDDGYEKPDGPKFRVVKK